MAIGDSTTRARDTNVGDLSIASSASIGIAGATGLVGRAMLSVLTEAGVTPDRIRPLASARSAGTSILIGDANHTVRALTADALDGLDVLLVALDDDLAREWVPIATARGVLVVDNSAAFRLDPDVPLVVPEVNGHLLDSSPMITANPNCSTITMVVPLAALAARGDLVHVHASTYQSVSGAGTVAIARLRDRSAAWLRDEPVDTHETAFNCVPAIGSIDVDGHAREERKMVRETRRILDRPELHLTCTTVRVPTEISHGVSVHAVFRDPMGMEEAAARLAAQPGLRLHATGDVPTSRDLVGRNDISVGRVRQGGDERTLALWCVADNVRKGAATNAVQIAARLLNS